MGRGTILVVDDDRDVREVLRDILEADGFAVETAADGREGLQKMSSVTGLSLVLLDLMMPVMSGLELLKARSVMSGIHAIPVVLLSAYANCADASDEVAARLPKPVEVATLLRVVHRHCLAA
ncbi:MAG TPA: response regulator [Polyangia bacterium]|jgi:CheY-like chemotaxis protein